MQARQPILFLSHGSPMTALGGDALSQTWAKLAERLVKPAAIVMISAHWNTHLPMLGGSAQPETVHDFGGFPNELYEIRYPAAGAPELAQRIKQQIADVGMVAAIDTSYGLDHGAWVPLRILFPAADVPVLQLSVQPDFGAPHHYALGTALASLADENILIVASGHLTHNLHDYMRPPAGERPAADTRAFREWVHARLMSGSDEGLLDWENAPGARYAHPTPEHFLPIFVALGATAGTRQTEWLGGGWLDDALAADNYLFA